MKNHIRLLQVMVTETLEQTMDVPVVKQVEVPQVRDDQLLTRCQ